MTERKVEKTEEQWREELTEFESYVREETIKKCLNYYEGIRNTWQDYRGNETWGEYFRNQLS
jgi:hypothetical protein